LTKNVNLLFNSWLSSKEILPEHLNYRFMLIAKKLVDKN
jgi:hypothetical protein